MRVQVVAGLLFPQGLRRRLHEGLRYEIMRAAGVSGVDSYNALCIAAKSEERRL